MEHFPSISSLSLQTVLYISVSLDHTKVDCNYFKLLMNEKNSWESYIANQGTLYVMFLQLRVGFQ